MKGISVNRSIFKVSAVTAALLPPLAACSNTKPAKTVTVRLEIRAGRRANGGRQFGHRATQAEQELQHHLYPGGRW